MQDIAIDERAQQIRMLRESAADFASGSADMKALRRRRASLPGYDPGLLRQMADLGWLGIVLPEAQGGLSLGLTEMAVVLEELGRGLLADPLPATAFAARAVLHGGNAGLQQRLLPGVADGSVLPCVAWQEGVGGIDPAAIRSQASAADGGHVLDGAKRFVAGAAGATGFVVTALADGRPGLFWVDAGAPGVTLRQEWRADETPSGIVELRGVRVEAAEVVAAPGPQAAAAFERAFDEAVMLASAEMLGVMQASLAMALAYMRTRVQFGKPIGSFQALQHKAADLYVQQELTRAVLDEALRKLDGEVSRTERAKVASRCKARASEAGLRVTREVIQLHGAIGYTDECDAGLYLKRALVLSGWLGNASAHRRRFAQFGEGAAL
ncbi:MAG: acyl-CoA/acyl-ACP dehydrogenase [Burkholderiales bacterium]|nr:acyl-CoA/acyl-ACP dehydrogenase [Burkholderiales bacterium]MDE2453135.1 acyl-CoA/acyl-ACP dehydrogenase [Burkholderiales bacterium]